MVEAAYLKTHRTGVLQRKVESLRGALACCRLCPRRCGVNRLADEQGFCRTGRFAQVSSYGPHFGEEAPLVGRGGSGTIFFTHCNLRCRFCQNYEISHLGVGRPVSPGTLADMMLSLQARGCHNVNFVSPSHVIPQIVEAVMLAAEGGLRVPLVYNSGGYDAAEGLRSLDGVFDIYMPDAKFRSGEVSRDLADAEDYPDVLLAALAEMHRQVGDLRTDARGVATRGLLVRHLVLPGGLAGTETLLGWIAEHLSRDTYVNIMDQYHPCGDVQDDEVLSRRTSSDEVAAARRAARQAGLHRLDPRTPSFRFPK